MAGLNSKHFVLPSGASHDTYPENTNSHFKVKLPERLVCKRGEWEVAMESITYHNNWDNATNAYMMVEDKTGQKHRVKFPDGRYGTVLNVLLALYTSLQMSQFYRYLYLYYSVEYGKPILSILDGDYSIEFSPDLADMLGFIPGKKYTKPDGDTLVVPENESNMQTVYEQLYVYSNLCDNMVVGDSSVPCLYNVPVRWTDEQTNLVGETVEEPMYVNAAALDTDVVEVDIRRRDGESVVFRGGRVVITVHLRKRSTQN